MYEVEALQIYEQSPALQRLTAGADPAKNQLDTFTRARLIDMQKTPIRTVDPGIGSHNLLY